MSAAERDRIRAAEQHLPSANRNDIRALAKAWDVPKKVAGKNRNVSEIREDLERKIQEAAKRLSESGESAVTRQSGAADSLEDAGASAVAVANTATALAEPVSSIAPALAEPGASTSSSGHGRGQKRDRAQMDEEPLGEKHEEDKPTGLEGLERDQVRKAIADLERMPASDEANKMRDILQQWRAARKETNCHERRRYICRSW